MSLTVPSSATHLGRPVLQQLPGIPPPLWVVEILSGDDSPRGWPPSKPKHSLQPRLIKPRANPHQPSQSSACQRALSWTDTETRSVATGRACGEIQAPRWSSASGLLVLVSSAGMPPSVSWASGSIALGRAFSVPLGGRLPSSACWGLLCAGVFCRGIPDGGLWPFAP